MSIPQGNDPVTETPKTRDDLRRDRLDGHRSLADDLIMSMEVIRDEDPESAMRYAVMAQAHLAAADLYWRELYG